MFIHVIKRILHFVLLGCVAGPVLAAEGLVTEEVEYKTDDGWTISGTLNVPAGAIQDNKFPGMVLLHEAEHDRHDLDELGEKLPLIGIATLAIDWRGRGKSMGKHQPIPDERHDFSTKMQEQSYLDVKGAMQFLADYPGVDRLRIGIVASQFGAEPAVRAMREAEFIPTRALVLMGGEGLTQESKDYLASIDTPIYAGASTLDKPVFLEMAQVYARAKNENSFMYAPMAAERGWNLFHAAELRGLPDPDAETDNLIFWLGTQVKNLGRIQAVSFKTRDGWTIHGNFRYPDDLGKSGKLVPGVIQVSGARSDRYGLYRFEEEMSRRGFAVLSIEMRGRGASVQPVDAPEVDEYEGRILDMEAAIEFLASQNGIDPDRLAVLGEARGAMPAILASEGDSRIKAMVLLSVYEPDERMKQIISQMDIPLLLVDGETNWAAEGTKSVHRLAKKSQLMIYPGEGHAHHIRYFHPEVVGFIGDFMERELPAEPTLMRLPARIFSSGK